MRTSGKKTGIDQGRKTLNSRLLDSNDKGRCGGGSLGEVEPHGVGRDQQTDSCDSENVEPARLISSGTPGWR